MYAGLMVEEAATADLFRQPCHPYTRGLLASVPKLDFHHPLGQILPAIPGQVPGARKSLPAALSGTAVPRPTTAAAPRRPG